MDTSHDTSSSREDNRISVESLTDWHRIKANYAESVLAVLEETIASEHLESQRDVLVAHATSVGIFLSLSHLHHTSFEN